jgi:hypothetical protein
VTTSPSASPPLTLAYNQALGDVFRKQRLRYGDISALARRWDMPAGVLTDWLTSTPLTWAASNALSLHRAGLTPAQGSDLYDLLAADIRPHIGRLLDAARMAELDLSYLDRWIRGGLVAAQITPSKKRNGQDKVVFTPWVTNARRFIAATAGNEHLASLAAAAGLTAEETATQFRAGTLNERTLHGLGALREGNRLWSPYLGT